MKFMDTLGCPARALQRGEVGGPVTISGTVLGKPGHQGPASSHTARVWTQVIRRSQA